MNIKKYLENMKKAYEDLLIFIDNENNETENFQNLNKTFQDIQIRDDRNNLRLFLHLIVNVSNNHHRSATFFNKIDQILKYFEEDIKNYFSNSELFIIFASNKRLLLFLIEEKIMNIDEYVVKRIITKKYVDKKYPQYFAPEILPFVNEKWFPKFIDENERKVFSYFMDKNEWVKEIKKELPDIFYEKRKKGENDSYICKLIQEDLIGDFIRYVEQKNILLKSTIEPSIYETNSFLIQQNKIKSGITLIEYAAFKGSIQIFNYLKNNGVEMTPSLWYYSIHGNNTEIIHLLEENHIEPTITKNNCNGKYEMKSYEECFSESIKCNHNGIANYILNKYLQNREIYSRETIFYSLKYYYFCFIQDECINDSFLCLCLYDYYSLVENLLATQAIDINQTTILTSKYSMIFNIKSFDCIQP